MLQPSGPIFIVVEGDGPLTLHSGHVGPVVARARQQHVAEQCLNGCLAYQTNEKQLLDNWRRDDAQGGQTEEEASKAIWLAGVLVPYVFLQGALGFLLDALNMGDV